MNEFIKNKDAYTNYWKSNNSKEIPGVSLVPNTDSTLLFVNSGMFPLVPYLSGQPHPLGKRIHNIQRCIRTDEDDLLEIGDKRHTTCFHMLGNWSLGDFFKKEQIDWVLKLYVEVFGLDVERLYVSVFAGDEDSPRDEESIVEWQKAFLKYGIKAKFSENPSDVQKNNTKKITAGDIETEIYCKDANFEQFKIFPFPKKKNWWQRGKAKGELGGPDSEIFFDLGKHAEEYFEVDMDINSDNNRFIEIGNNVFMQFFLEEKDGKLVWKELPQKNVDFGGGMERVMMCQLNQINGADEMFALDLFRPVINELERISGINYEDSKKLEDKKSVKAFRIIADHIRASSLIIADGIIPSNKAQGYILRRFIRRMVLKGRDLGIEQNFVSRVAEKLISISTEDQPQLIENMKLIIETIDEEESKFRKTLISGMTEFEKMIKSDNKISGDILFTLYETYGFPYEMSIEILKERNLNFNQDSIFAEYNEAKVKHQELSRLGAEKIFKGGLADNSEIVTALHTTQHLLLAAIQAVLGKNIHQKGSNITSERIRLDFNFERKLEKDEIDKIEEMVQKWIASGLLVERLEMNKEDAEKLGAEMEFGAKYPEKVTIYKIENISLEFCGGPHVKNTTDILNFGKFKIMKEESSSSGIRRIKATLI